MEKLANIETPRKKTDNILNSIKESHNEKYYGFVVRKTKIPPKSMQRSPNITNVRTQLTIKMKFG